MREASTEASTEAREEYHVPPGITCADPAGSLDQLVEALRALENYLISGGNIGRY